MKQLILETINRFKENIINAGTLAVNEVLYLDYAFEVDHITFNIDYSDALQKYDVYNCEITFNYGNPNGEPWYRGNIISINNIPEYKLDDINYLYGIFYGYFCAKEQEEK
jgi:hypothetical protein